METNIKTLKAMKFNVLFPLPNLDSDSDSDTDSCTMHDFSIGSDSDSDPLIEMHVKGTEICTDLCS